jgi:hypothetical protein
MQALHRPSILVRMATIPHRGHARNGRPLAQGRIPAVLEADLQGQEARRETTDLVAALLTGTAGDLMAR